ncbi:hypothetical protein A6769_35510 [Nostoc punctiforme NIES-2108]|uniref:ATPase AAA-type core domain-containing protein n=1 Tax=Nostoc punctiforme NIES-2108 TaxID=1356359 RepID=A0A367R0T3_NOSPU|nr:hypothetical protein A6769_35510 [Nostoc punctiforme NIES-2108]
MLKKIGVTNFKVIKDSGLLELKPLTVLIGRNSSGKSSLIETLDWLGQAIDNGADAATERFQRIGDVINGWTSADTSRTFGVRLFLDPEDVSAGEEVCYEIKVASDNLGDLPKVVYEQLSAETRDGSIVSIQTSGGTRQRRVNLEVIAKLSDETEDYLNNEEEDEIYEALTDDRSEDEANKDEEAQWKAEIPFISKETEFEYKWLPSTNPDRLALSEVEAVEDRAGDLVRDFLERAVFLRLSPRSIASFTPPRMKHSPRLLDDEGYRLAALLGELDQETIEILIEKLSFIIEGANNLEAHHPGSPADRRYFTFIEASSDGEILLQIPAWVLSEGTRRVTAILAILLHDNPPPLLCIEEIENGLDPWTIKYILDELTSAVERGTQVILTSHSPYLLNLFPSENIIFCDRQLDQVIFTSADKLPGLELVETRMGTGDLYASRYFHESRVNMEADE